MKTKDWKYSDKYIGVLDGVRAFAIFVIAWYHIWQQAWVMPTKDLEWLEIFNYTRINLEWLVRYGFEMVDLMLLLSGFCLFLPYARTMVHGGEEPNLKQFYKKRVARIVPSYYFALLVALFVANQDDKYADLGAMWRDLIPHLFFVHTYTRDSYVLSQLNGVLWTLAVEVQFYLIFPFVAKLFKKWTVQTYFAMVAISWMFINWGIVDRVDEADYGMWINQLPTFFGVYANGMMAALVVVKLADVFNKYLKERTGTERLQHKKQISYFFTMLSVICIFLFYRMMTEIGQAENMNRWQILNRFEMSLLFAVFVVACTFASSMLQLCFSNPVMRFLSGISFQFYIWHQWLACLLKNRRIPAWEGDVPPNQTGDTVWMDKYFWLCWLAALAAAIAGTYLIERPCTKLIMKLGKNKE